MIDLELKQARQAAQKAMGERETYIRLLACLVNILRGNQEYAEIGGHVAIPNADYMAVPTMFKVNVYPAKAKEDGDEDAEEIDMLVVEVTVREDGNGTLSIPKRPGIILPP